MGGLNDQLLEARIAAGLIPLTGSGVVLQLEDSLRPVSDGASEADYLVTALDVRTLVRELWLAGAEAIAVNEERVTPTTAIIDIGPSVLVNSAYLAPPFRITRDRPGRPVRPAQCLARVRRPGPRQGRRLRDPPVVRGARAGGRAGLRGHDHVALRPPAAGRVAAAQREPGRLTMGRRRNQVTIAAVCFVLGLLVIVQLRAQTVGSPLAQLSSQELTVLVANLNGRNDQLRREVATLERDLETLTDQ